MVCNGSCGVSARRYLVAQFRLCRRVRHPLHAGVLIIFVKGQTAAAMGLTFGTATFVMLFYNGIRTKTQLC